MMLAPPAATLAAMGDRNKTKFLGMPYGTACYRLRKQLLFRLAQRTGDARCCRCGTAIESVDDFTIDHLRPWLHVSPDLFWDLENIGFSHRRCNVVDRPTAGTKYVVGDDRAWCSICRSSKPRSEFYRNRRSATGLQSECRECHRTWEHRRPARRSTVQV